MNASLIPTAVISLFLLCIIAGFLVGYIRGFSKSLVRFIILLAVTVLTFFVVPAITSAVLKMDISKWNINIGGVQVVTLGDLIVDLLEKIPVVQELIESSPTFESIITLAPQMISNVVLFIVFFFVFKWVSMIIYWIIAGIFFSKKKMKDKDKHKFVGALIGTLQGLMIAIVLLVPIYGIVETSKPMLNALEASQQTETKEEQSAETFVYGVSQEEMELLKEDEGQIVPEENEGQTGSESGENQGEKTYSTSQLIDETKPFIDAFENTWIIKVFNALKIKNISVAMFDGLTTVEDKHLEVKLRKEVNTIAKAYPGLSGLLNGTADTEDPEVYDDLNDSFNTLYSSPVLSGVVYDLIPAVSMRWSEGEEFCGFKKPTFSDSATNAVFDALLLNLQSPKDKESLRTDLSTSIDVMKVCASSGLVGALKGKTDLLDTLLLEKNENLLSDIIDLACKSVTLKKCLPEIINLGMSKLYDALGIEDIPENENNEEIVWDTEKVQLQKVFTNFLKLYDEFEKGKEQGKEKLDCLDFASLGRVFDGLRASQILSGTSKAVLDKLFESNFIGGSQTTVLNSFKDQIDKVWTDETVTMESTFVSIQKALVLAKDLNSKTGEISKENIGEIISGLAENEALKETVNTILNDEQTMKDLGLDETTAGVVKDTIGKVINSDLTEEQLSKEVDAVTEIYDVVNKVMSAEETEKITAEDINAETLVDSIANSEIIKSVLLPEKSGEGEEQTSAIEDMNLGDSLDDDAIDAINQAIENNQTLTEEEAEALKALFSKKSSTENQN